VQTETFETTNAHFDHFNVDNSQKRTKQRFRFSVNDDQNNVLKQNKALLWTSEDNYWKKLVWMEIF